MNKLLRFGGIVCATGLVMMPAGATYNATIDGQISALSQLTGPSGYTGNSFAFTLDSGPATPCVANGYVGFIVSSNSVADAEARRNIFAMLTAAKMSGSAVRVGYDNAGGYCDQGRYAVYWISAL